jgi:hypothetical protein
LTKIEYGSGEDAQPFRAQAFIPCLINQCAVPMDDGTERPSRMQLIVARQDGAMLQRPFNDGPVYVCEREGCYYHDNPRGLHEINSRWIQAESKQKNTVETEADIEDKSEVLI